MLSVIAAITPC